MYPPDAGAFRDAVRLTFSVIDPGERNRRASEQVRLEREGASLRISFQSLPRAGSSALVKIRATASPGCSRSAKFPISRLERSLSADAFACTPFDFDRR